MMPQSTMPQPIPLRFKVDDYYKMIELGMLEDYEQAEIIEGELIKKMPIGERHAFVVDNLNRFFNRNVCDDVLIRVQNPLRISDFDELEPDIVLADLTKFDGKRHPRPAETFLVVKVSDTTLKYDRDTKLSLYAEAGISEVWIVNLKNDIIEVHQNSNIGIYQLTKIYKRGETVESSVLPHLRIEVDKILG